MSLTNAERQKRFRQLTLKQRQLKADAIRSLFYRGFLGTRLAN